LQTFAQTILPQKSDWFEIPMNDREIQIIQFAKFADKLLKKL